LLLNIGPPPDGTIPDEVQNTLLDVGAWLKQNGEAIYDTVPWMVYGEGPTKIKPGFGHDIDTKPYTAEDFRFTQKGNMVYAIEMAWPSDGRAVIHALGSNQQGKGLEIKTVTLLGAAGKLEFHQTNEALVVQLPAQPTGVLAGYALALAIETRTQP